MLQIRRKNGLSILDEYIDRATTGTNDNRPAFQKMLADSERTTAWDIVLVYAIDRFGRNSIEIAINKQKLIKTEKSNIGNATHINKYRRKQKLGRYFARKYVYRLG